MKRFAIFLIAISLQVPLAQAQFFFGAMGSRGAGMGGCSTALTDVGSATNNVAAWALQKRAAVTLSGRNVSLLSQLSSGEMAVGLPVKRMGCWALAYDYSGSPAYNEQRASLAYALAAGPVAMGVRLDGLRSATADAYYAPLHQYSFAAAMLVRLSQRCVLGARMEGRDFYSVGLSCRLPDGLLGTVEMEYGPHLRARAGVEYTYQRRYFARMGIATGPITYTFGLGCHYRRCAFDLAMQMVQPIGATTQISVSYHF